MKRKKQKQPETIDVSIRNILVAMFSVSLVLAAGFLIIFYLYVLIKSGLNPTSGVFTLATEFLTDAMEFLFIR